jgi:hypothetical protein
VYAAQPPLQLLTGEPGKTAEPLSYKLVRPSLVNAQLIGPDGVPHVLEANVQHDPGSYPFTFSASDEEGTWHWNVTATDDLKRTSTIDRTFRYDTTLTGLTAGKPARGTATFPFTLSRAATVKLTIETRGGVVIRALAAASLQPGAESLSWDGKLPRGSRAFGGAYVADVVVTSQVGTSDLTVPFTFTRVAP